MKLIDRRIAVAAVGILVGIALIAKTAFSAGEVAVLGTRVTMTPPKGFKLADRYAGFTSDKEEATILIAEIPMELKLATRDFNAKGFEKKGMTLLAPPENKKFGTTPGMLFLVSQKTEGKTEMKWLAALGEIETTLITATFPSTQEKVYSAALKTALLSARIPDELPSKVE